MMIVDDILYFVTALPLDYYNSDVIIEADMVYPSIACGIHIRFLSSQTVIDCFI